MTNIHHQSYMVISNQSRFFFVNVDSLASTELGSCFKSRCFLLYYMQPMHSPSKVIPKIYHTNSETIYGAHTHVAYGIELDEPPLTVINTMPR